MNINEILSFQGQRLIKEDAHVVIWEEVFEPSKPTPPHRHLRDCIVIPLNAGELTVTPLVGKPEEYTPIAGEGNVRLTKQGAVRLTFSAETIVCSRVSEDGHGHKAGGIKGT